MKSGLRFLAASLILTLGFGACERAVMARPSLAAIAAAKSATTSGEHKIKLDLVTEGMKTAFENGGLFKMWYNDQRLLILIKSSSLDKEFIVDRQGIQPQRDVIGGMYLGFDDDVITGFQEGWRQPARSAAQRPLPGQFGHARGRRRLDGVQRQRAVFTSHRDRRGRWPPRRLHSGLHERRSDDRPFDRGPSPPFHLCGTARPGPKSKSSRTTPSCASLARYSGMQNLQTVIDPTGTGNQVLRNVTCRQPTPDRGERPRGSYFSTSAEELLDKGDDQHFVSPSTAWNLKKNREAPIRPPSSRSSSISKTPFPRTCGRTLPRAFSSGTVLRARRTTRSTSSSRATTKSTREHRPEDAINYNFFRWITAEGRCHQALAVNPKTGEILDADILFDDSFLRLLEASTK